MLAACRVGFQTSGPGCGDGDGQERFWRSLRVIWKVNDASGWGQWPPFQGYWPGGRRGAAGALGYTGGPPFPRVRRGCDSRAGGAASTRDPRVWSSSRRSRGPLLSTFPAAAGREEGTILKEARLASVGARGSTVEAARGGGAGGGAWSRRGPAEHRSAGAGGTVSASKGRGPYRAAPQAPLAGDPRVPDGQGLRPF